MNNAILGLVGANRFHHKTGENIMTNLMKRFFREDDGATAIEYGLIAALIAVAIVAVLLALGPQLQAVFTKVTTTLTAAVK
jgi:pilus assembly protein Flp/PilA